MLSVIWPMQKRFFFPSASRCSTVTPSSLSFNEVCNVTAPVDSERVTRSYVEVETLTGAPPPSGIVGSLDPFELFPPILVGLRACHPRESSAGRHTITVRVFGNQGNAPRGV